MPWNRPISFLLLKLLLFFRSFFEIYVQCLVNVQIKAFFQLVFSLAVIIGSYAPCV